MPTPSNNQISTAPHSTSSPSNNQMSDESKESKDKMSESMDAPFRFLDQPREIRDMVYKLLLVRPSGIAPDYSWTSERPPNSDRSRKDQRFYKGREYKYQWEHLRQRSFHSGSCFPPLNGALQKLEYIWTTSPTAKQQKLIDGGASEFPSTITSIPYYSNIEHRIHRRAGGVVEVVNIQEILVTAFRGVKLLYTNKQIHAEATEILYGHNKFVFNSAMPELKEISIAPKHKSSGTSKQKAIEKVFNYQAPPLPRNTNFHLNDPLDDPLFKFFNTIGRRNASLITSIKLEGEFKTARNITRHGPTVVKCLSFAQILPHYTFLIRNICTNLRTLHLNTDEYTDYRYFGDHTATATLAWPDDPFNKAKKSDEERVAEVVKKVIDDLPSLQQLQLGDFCPPWDKKDDGWLPDVWGKALQYVRVVEERNQRRLLDDDETTMSTTKKKNKGQGGRGSRNKGKGSSSKKKNKRGGRGKS